MSITITSGGFDGIIRSDAAGDIFIESAANSKKITIGGLIEYTGSIIRSLDKATGKVIEEKQQDEATGKTFIRSGSATANQIEMQQTTAGAFISVSGSSGNTGYNLIESDKFKLIRSTHDTFVSGASVITVATLPLDINGSSQFNINPNVSTTRQAATLFTVSSSGDVFIKKDLTIEGNITANEYVVNSSVTNITTLAQSGSTIFGDSPDDTHQFTGSVLLGTSSINSIQHITASGNITAGGTITAEQITSTDDMTVTDDLNVQGQINLSTDIVHTLDADTKIAFGTDVITMTAGGIEMLKLVEGVADAVTINEGGVDVNLRVESSGNANMLFVDAGNNKVGIGTSAPSQTLEVVGTVSASKFLTATFLSSPSASITNLTNTNITSSGNISSSGTIFADSGSFNYITASKIDVDADTIRIGGESIGKTLVQNLKRGHSSTALSPVGRIQKTADLFEAGDISASFQTCKYVLQVASASNIQSSEMLVIQNGSNTFNTEYAQINSSLNLTNFSTKVNLSNVELISSSSFVSCSVKFVRTLI